MTTFIEQIKNLEQQLEGIMKTQTKIINLLSDIRECNCRQEKDRIKDFEKAKNQINEIIKQKGENEKEMGNEHLLKDIIEKLEQLIETKDKRKVITIEELEKYLTKGKNIKEETSKLKISPPWRI